jgi:uncharacterized protein (DUF302 family)
MSGDKVISVSESGGASAAFQKSRLSAAPFTEAVWRLREAIETADFWVLQEVDTQLLLRRAGYAVGPVRQILFFHPRFMARILAADSAALLEAPLKIAILGSTRDGVQLRWNNPAPAFARYGHPDLAVLGLELAAACDEIVAKAVRQNGAPAA